MISVGDTLSADDDVFQGCSLSPEHFENLRADEGMSYTEAVKGVRQHGGVTDSIVGQEIISQAERKRRPHRLQRGNEGKRSSYRMAGVSVKLHKLAVTKHGFGDARKIVKHALRSPRGARSIDKHSIGAFVGKCCIRKRVLRPCRAHKSRIDDRSSLAVFADIGEPVLGIAVRKGHISCPCIPHAEQSRDVVHAPRQLNRYEIPAINAEAGKPCRRPAGKGIELIICYAFAVQSVGHSGIASELFYAFAYHRADSVHNSVPPKRSRLWLYR